MLKPHPISPRLSIEDKKYPVSKRLGASDKYFLITASSTSDSGFSAEIDSDYGG